MKVAFISDSVSRNAGGLFEANRQLALGLQSLGDEVTVIGVTDDFSAADRPEWGSVPVQVAEARGPRRLGYAPAMEEQLERFPADVLHSHGLWTFTSLVSLRWHRRTGRPHVIHPHGMLDPWALRHSRWKKRLAAAVFERAHLDEAACLRALCESELRAMRAFGLRNPVCLVPNGVELPASEDMATATGSRTRPKRLLYLGRLHAKKGLENLLRAWAEVRPQETWQLDIAGWDDGGHEADLKELATRLGLKWEARAPGYAGRTPAEAHPVDVRFVGPCFGGAKGELYRNCDAFILPSFSEGLPMVVLEAWSHGKPVAMTPACNLPEGFACGAALTMEASASGVAEGLRNLFALGRDERQAMGRQGRRLVEEKFSWPRVASQIAHVNAWLVGGGPPPETVMQ